MSQNIEDDRQKWPGNSENFTVGIKTVSTNFLWQPQSDYSVGGEYGKVHVTTYESGHSIEFDDTPGGERIRITHANGSFTEWQHNGDVLTRSNGSDFEIVVKDKNVKVKGALNVHIEGDANIKVGGDMFAEVDGALDMTISNTAKIKSGGDMTLTFQNLVLHGDSVSHDGINIGKDHVHKDVMPGSSDTGTPEPL